MSSTTQYLTRPEGKIAYDLSGRGPLVVMIPGMGDLRSIYRFLVPALVETGYRVATLDLRGHGESDATFTQFDDVAAARDVLALIEEVSSPAVVIGNSMGAGAAVWAAAEAPALVKGLVLIGPFLRNPPVNKLQMAAFRLGLVWPWGPAAWNQYYKTLYPSRPPADLDQHRRQIHQSLRRPAYWKAFVSTTRTSHAPVEARLAEVHAPSMVVMGEKDPDFKDPGAEAGWIASRLDSEVLMVPGAGHYPQAEFPELVASRVVAFLGNVAHHA